MTCALCGYRFEGEAFELCIRNDAGEARAFAYLHKTCIDNYFGEGHVIAGSDIRFVAVAR